MIKNKKGISLIVLSITILVMAILAATAIIALEDSGIIKRGKDTVKNNNYSDEYTRLIVIKNGLLTDNIGTITVDEYVTELTNKGLIESTIVSNADGSKTVTTKTGFTVNVSQNGASDLSIVIDGYTPPSSNTGNSGDSGSTATPTITLNKTTISKTIDSGTTATETLTATIQNISGSLTWTSSNTSVATVSASGNTATVTMKAGGTAIITATYGSTSASCTVTVTENEVVTSTATVTTASIYSVSYGDGEEALDNSNVQLDLTMNKSDSSENLVYRLRFDYADYSDYTSNVIPVTKDYMTYEFTSTKTSITYTFNSGNWLGTYKPVLVTLEVYNENDIKLTEYIFNKYSVEVRGNVIEYTYYVVCMPAGTLILVEEEYEDENGKKKKRRKKKKIEDLTYDDDLVVWDFDNGCFTTAKPLWLKKAEVADEYNELTFSNGAVLKTIREHRIFNKELGKFTYPMGEETNIGTTTFTEDGEEVTLTNRRVVDEKVEYYNVITNYHINAFAEGILTSCRLSNLYDIKDMKYVKDDREIVDIKEFKDIPEEYYYGLRLGEQRRNVNNEGDFSELNSWTEYVNRLISRKK